MSRRRFRPGGCRRRWQQRRWASTCCRPKVDFAKFGEIEVKPLSRIKKISGQNLSRNWVMIPAVTYHECRHHRPGSLPRPDEQGNESPARS
jgi:hypothetical protein